MKQSLALTFLLTLGLLLGAGLAVADEKADDARVTSSETHVITRDAPAKGETDRTEYFTHEWFNREPFAQPVASCSGQCNATTCTCTGDFDCCVAGCVICFELVDQL